MHFISKSTTLFAAMVLTMAMANPVPAAGPFDRLDRRDSPPGCCTTDGYETLLELCYREQSCSSPGNPEGCTTVCLSLVGRAPFLFFLFFLPDGSSADSCGIYRQSMPGQ